METAKILKAGNVILQGTHNLDSSRPSAAPAKEKNASSVPVSARIIDTQPQYAIIEVTCSCGTKTQVKCEF